MTPRQQINNILEHLNKIAEQYCLDGKVITPAIRTNLDFDGFALVLSSQDYEFSYGRQSKNAIILSNVDPRDPLPKFKQNLKQALLNLQHELEGDKNS